MRRLTLLIWSITLTALASCGGDSGGSSGVPSAPSGPSVPVTPTPTPTVAVTGVSINKETLSLVEGGSDTLTAIVFPPDATNKSVSWKSSDTSVASIDANGIISAKVPGKVTITVTTTDGNKAATLSLTVTVDYILRQKKVLVALFEAMGGDTWTKKDGWKKDNVELKNWYGITMEGDHVVSINLSNNNLKGMLPASLGETLAVTRALMGANTRADNGDEATTRATETLTLFGQLRLLDLSNNEISGSIPPEIGNLTQLNNLNLSDNSISGSIPSTIGNLSKLTNLDLSDNNLSGSIPPEVGKLIELKNLDLGNNELTGSVPNELGKLSKLENLKISDNKLTGDISIDLQNSDMWKNLKEEPDLKQQDGIELEKEKEPEPTDMQGSATHEGYQ